MKLAFFFGTRKEHVTLKGPDVELELCLLLGRNMYLGRIQMCISGRAICGTGVLLRTKNRLNDKRELIENWIDAGKKKYKMWDHSWDGTFRNLRKDIRIDLQVTWALTTLFRVLFQISPLFPTSSLSGGFPDFINFTGSFSDWQKKCFVC